MENIQAILHVEDYNLSDLVQSNMYLSSMNPFIEFNNRYAKYFDSFFPVRATVEIDLTAVLVEIAIAYKE